MTRTPRLSSDTLRIRGAGAAPAESKSGRLNMAPRELPHLFALRSNSLRDQSFACAKAGFSTGLSTAIVDNRHTAMPGFPLNCALCRSRCATSGSAAPPDLEGVFFVWDILKEAGWPIYPLLAASIIAVALIIERLMVLRKSRIIPAQLLGEVLTLYKNKQITPEIIGRIEANSLATKSGTGTGTGTPVL